MTPQVPFVSPPLSELLQRKVDVLEEAIRTHYAATYTAVDNSADMEDILQAYERANETLWNTIGADND